MWLMNYYNHTQDHMRSNLEVNGWVNRPLKCHLCGTKEAPMNYICDNEEIVLDFTQEAGYT